MSVPPSGRFRVPFGADRSLRWQTALVLNVPPACVTYLRTRSKKPPEKSYDLFDLTSPVSPFVIPVSLFCGPKWEGGKRLPLGVPGGWPCLPQRAAGDSPCAESLHLTLMMLYTAFSRASLEILPRNRFELENIPLLPLYFLPPLLLPPPPPLSRTALKV